MKDIIDYNWSSKIMFIIIFSKLKMGLKKNSVKKQYKTAYASPKLHFWGLSSWDTIHWACLFDQGLLVLCKPGPETQASCKLFSLVNNYIYE